MDGGVDMLNNLIQVFCNKEDTQLSQCHMVVTRICGDDGKHFWHGILKHNNNTLFIRMDHYFWTKFAKLLSQGQPKTSINLQSETS